MKKIIKTFLIILLFSTIGSFSMASEQTEELLNPEWSFKGFFGKFDRGSLQRGYQVYTEVCSACHSIKHLSYRNLSETGGPEFTEEQVKIMASQFEVTDGPNNDGDMFTRPARPSDNFVSPYENEQAAKAANGGAYPPDMSVLVKARKGGADYIYSLLLGYEDPPSGISLDDGVYYNKYMPGNNIKMSNPLSEGLVQYSDGTSATKEQMAKDVVTFLSWAAEPHLEKRHKMGFRTIIYLIILTIIVYFSMKKIWSRIESEV
jgi:ubiquinol-cytochrome c reductase cytochrome c1 subunit